MNHDDQFSGTDSGPIGRLHRRVSMYVPYSSPGLPITEKPTQIWEVGRWVGLGSNRDSIGYSIYLAYGLPTLPLTNHSGSREEEDRHI